MEVRPLTPPDLPALGALAETIWRAHYPGIISHAQIDYMLERMYSQDALRHQRDALDHRFWLATEGPKLVGYASIENTQPGEYFLHKLYVDTRTQRRGVGRALLTQMEQEYRPDTLSLHVNRANIQAINFYIRQGFFIDRLQVTDIGAGFVMDDFVMRKTYESR